MFSETSLKRMGSDPILNKDFVRPAKRVVQVELDDEEELEIEQESGASGKVFLLNVLIAIV